MTTLAPFPFAVDGKSLTATPAADGDLILEGWAARWEIDRENEAFDPAAFDAGVKAFLEGTAALCFQHRPSEVLGRVLSLERRPEGLWMRARVDGAIRSHPSLGTLYAQIKNGTIRGCSVGGLFRRSVKAGRRIIDRADLTEISLTATPIGGHRTTFAVVAGKALADPAPELGAAAAVARLELAVVQREIDEMREGVAWDRLRAWSRS